MKVGSKLGTAALLCAAVGILGACGSKDDPKHEITVSKVELSPREITLEIGEDLQLVVTAYDEEGAELRAGVEPLFRSGRPEVATVDPMGLVHAVAPGEAEIRVDVAGKEASALVVVARPIDFVEIQPNPVELFTTQSVQLRAVAYDSEGETQPRRTFTWKVENERIATISEDGLLTALRRDGTTEVIAISEQGVEGRATVEVRKGVHTVDVTPAAQTIREGEVYQLEAAVRDDGGQRLEGWEVTWSSSDTDVATVDQEGRVTGVVPGEVTITAEAGGVEGVAEITVRLERVTRIEVEPEAIELVIGESMQLDIRTFNLAGERVFGRTIHWEAQDALGTNHHRANAAISVDEAGVLSASFPLLGQLRFSVPGDSVIHDVPVKVVVRLAQVTAGREHSCGLTAEGQAWCWGGNDDRELGRDDLDRLPRPISADLTFTSLSAGSGHTCGLAEGGAAYCWGANGYGQLGDGSTEGGEAPVLVQLPQGVDGFASIHAGSGYTCALDDAGLAYCWGRNADGALGDGTTDDRLTPTAVVGEAGAAGPIHFRSLSVGQNSTGTHATLTCGVSLGDVGYCWGKNDEEEHGIGAGDTILSSDRPVPVAGGHAFQSIAVGQAHACGLATDGSPLCWGYGVWGQLGDGEGDVGHFRLEPHPAQTTETFQSIVAGGDSTCATDVSGGVHCWGRIPLPGQKDTVPTPKGWSGESLSMSEVHTCGVAEEVVHCFGSNPQGQMGIDRIFNQAVEPTPLYPENEEDGAGSAG